jgi:6-phosphogluconate dehydrogenase (decarboxylating)
VVYGTNGLKSRRKTGDIYIDMSTNSRSLLRRIAKDARTVGVSVLDAPTSGGTIGAEKGACLKMWNTIHIGLDSETGSRPELHRTEILLICLRKEERSG